MLTEEQKQRIERNREAALKRKAELERQRNQSNNSTNVNQNNSIPKNNQSTNIQNNNQPKSNNVNQQVNGINQFTNQNRSIQNVNNQTRPNQQNNQTRPNQQNNNSNQYQNKNNNSNQYQNKNNQVNSSNSSSNMTQLKNIWNQNNNFITPAKRQADQNPIDKRFKNNNAQVKSPYEQVMDRSIPTVEIKYKLLDNKEFYLEFRFNQKLIDEIKNRLKGKSRYDPNLKAWTFKLIDYKEVCEQVNKIKIDRLNIKRGEGFPKDLLELLEDSTKYSKVNVLLDGKISENVLNSLFKYQIEGVKFAIKREGRVLLADDMGLGKTIQALTIAMYYSDEWPLLIFSPASVKFQWVEAILKWVPGIQRNDIREIDCKKKNPKDTRTNLIIISSYDSAHKVDQFISEPKCVILDESHMVKCMQSQRYKLISKLTKKTTRLILISGTPAMSRPEELFTQLKLLMPNRFSNKAKFADRYCDPRITKFGKRCDGCSRPDELKVVLESTVMIRRMKHEVLNELPPKRRIKINLDCHLVGRDKSEMEKFLSRFKGSDQLKTNDESFTQAFTKTAEIKLEPTCNYLDIILEKETKFIIFGHHRSFIDGISDYLQNKKKTFIRIDGSTSSDERSKCIQLFQNDPNCKCAVLSITAAGVGITLTAAELVIFGELYFTPGTLIQAEDRVHRIGQKNSVLIEYLIAPGTVDDHIWNLIHRKLKTLDEIGLKSNDDFVFQKSTDTVVQ